MYSGSHALGMPPRIMENPQWYYTGDGSGESSDYDLISTAFYSPDAGFPPQRIHEYDLPLAEHQTLNGHGIGQLPTRQRSGAFWMTRLRTVFGGPMRHQLFRPLGARSNIAGVGAMGKMPLKRLLSRGTPRPRVIGRPATTQQYRPYNSSDIYVRRQNEAF